LTQTGAKRYVTSVGRGSAQQPAVNPRSIEMAAPVIGAGGVRARSAATLDLPGSVRIGTVLTVPSIDRLRCPYCRAIDWFRDGCVIAETDASVELRCSRVLRPELGFEATPWSCAQCGHEVAANSRLVRDLDEIRLQTCDESGAA
jgi:hypothetical protein